MENEVKELKKPSFMKTLFEYFKVIVAALILTILITTFIGQLVHVSGTSMENTLHNEDVVICDKISYKLGDPERFDIVILFPNNENMERLIKRVIALPGETIRIDAYGNIYVNGVVLEENYGKEVIREAGLAGTEITLSEDEYFCMGDNRNNSLDSRDIGPVKREYIIGRAIFRIQPLTDFGTIE